MTAHKHAEIIKDKADNDTEVGFIHLTNNCGKLKIINYISSRKVLIEFIETGYRTVVQKDSIRKGKIKDPYALTVYGVGFVGEGYTSRDKNGHTKAYETWHSMMARCYNKEHQQYDNYGGRGVSVHHDWHNFQNFAKWFYENYEKGKELDKDKLSGKSHGDIYSEHWCCFITPQENTALSQSKPYSVTNPDGNNISFTNMRAFCRMNNLDRSALLRVINGEANQHKGWTSIKPRKEKRWIGVHNYSRQTTPLIDSHGACTDYVMESCILDGSLFSEWQVIEIEVEV